MGGIVAADYLEDDNGGRGMRRRAVASTTPLPPAGLLLMKRGIISVVGVRTTRKGERLVCQASASQKRPTTHHLQVRGRDFNGPTVFEILHGVTFTGWAARPQGRGTPDSAGGVPSEPARPIPTWKEIHDGRQNQPVDDQAAEGPKKKPPSRNRARSPALPTWKGKPAAQGPGRRAAETRPGTGKSGRLLLLGQELLTRLEKQGLSSRPLRRTGKPKLKRLAELSDEAFAHRGLLTRTPAQTGKSGQGQEEKPADSDPGGKPAAKASTETPLRSDAGVPPRCGRPQGIARGPPARRVHGRYRNRVGGDLPNTPKSTHKEGNTCHSSIRVTAASPWATAIQGDGQLGQVVRVVGDDLFAVNTDPKALFRHPDQGLRRWRNARYLLRWRRHETDVFEGPSSPETT